MTPREFLVQPGRRMHLARVPTGRTPGIKGKADAEQLLARNAEALADAQERLYIQDRWSLLVVFQAMDAAGKDSTIKHVMRGVNPQGVTVTSFKAPSALELDHDYLWRSVVALPARGMIGIHNRSYYEEVLVARVHPEIVARQKLPDEARKGDLWGRRYRQINDFERHLVENGTVVLKFFLHVSKDEQRRRFLERIDDPSKNWKFSLRDVSERERWKDYQRAYEDMIEATSTRVAPWYVIPADRKWYMQLVVGNILVDTLEAMKLRIPPIDAERRKELAEGRRLLGGASGKGL
jgi:PPK2 family polyphosphate:nucleotide phosphotransferase